MLMAAVLVYVIAARYYGKHWTLGLDASVDFSRNTAVCGDTVDLVEIVTNDKWMPIPFINVKFQLDRKLHFDGADANANITDKTYKNDVFSLLFYQRITRRIPVKCTKRGVFYIDEMDIISKGLFMDEIMSYKKKFYKELVVYPYLANVDRIEILFRQINGELITKRNLFEDDFEFRGVREYQSYDTQKSINWNASAKTGQLKVNLHDYTNSKKVCIFLDLSKEGMLVYEDLLEESISIAAGLVNRFSKENIQVSLITNGIDSITKETVTFDYAVGKNHMVNINRGLARIDLNNDMKGLADRIEDNDSDTIYVMVSSSKDREIQAAYQKKCEKGQGKIWILPYHSGMETTLDFCKGATVIPWEVSLRG